MKADNLFRDLVPLCDGVALPLIDVRDDIRRHFKDSPHPERIIKNLETIQGAVQQIARDYEKVRAGLPQPVSKLQYVWP